MIYNFFYNKRISCILVFLICFIYSSVMSFHFMPVSEGWYTYYSVLINNGVYPYADFCYLFSPLYIYLISFFTNIFGYDIYLLRILGCFFFSFIGISLFLLLSQLFERWIAMIGAIVGALYLQSEAPQVFYDYVRLMDIFSTLTTFFLIISLKKILCNDDKFIDFVAITGVLCSCFILVKQNMGLIFWAYVIVAYFLTGIYLKKTQKFFVKTIGVFILATLILPLLTILWMHFSGALNAFLNSSGNDAIAAKGGMRAILFNWLINNSDDFYYRVPKALFLATVIISAKYIHFKFASTKKVVNHISMQYLFTCLYLIGFCVFLFFEPVARYFITIKHISINPYTIFMTACFLLLFFFSLMRKNYLGNTINEENFLITIVLGAYFSISYGCGTSGGLAEGQASIGLSLLVCMIFHYINFHFPFSKLIFIFMTAFIVLFCLNSSDKKMINSYNWWGCNDSSIWDSKYYSHIPKLKYLALSQQQVNLYDDIYDIIQKNSTSTDTMIVFPHIPIFYALNNRPDTGIYCKVQWFDVVNDKSIDNDIRILKEKNPKIVLIYDTASVAYEAHEKLFRKGKRSATRRLREFLYNLVYEKGYTYYGTFFSENNKIKLFILNSNDHKTIDLYASGDGSIEKPYILDSTDQMKMFARMVNEGRTFDGMYFRLGADIDYKGSYIRPIGVDSQNAHFDGFFNGDGYTIKNFNIVSDGDAGLFDCIGGVVYNINLLSGFIKGSRCGAIACKNFENRGFVVNCYSDVSINGGIVNGIVSDLFGSGISNTVYSGQVSGLQIPNSRGSNYYDTNKPGSYLNDAILNYNVYNLASNSTVVEKKLNLNYWETISDRRISHYKAYYKESKCFDEE